MEFRLPKKPGWDSDVESWTESEGTSSSERCIHNVESFALNVIGQKWSGEKVSLFPEDWELAGVALSCPHCPGYVVPGNVRGLVAGLPLPGEPTVTARKALLSLWRGCDSKGDGCGERN